MNKSNQYEINKAKILLCPKHWILTNIIWRCRKLHHDLYIVENCLYGGAPKAYGSRISVDSFIIIIRPFYLHLSPLYFSLSFIHSYLLDFLSLFYASPLLSFKLHRFSNISRSRHHCGHQSREWPDGL